jgi:nucleoside-diphosphate-sugar epimerase
MRILITGIAGGIGSTLGWKLFNLNHDIFGIDNFNNGYESNLTINGQKYVNFTKLDIRDNLSLRSLLINNKIEAVIHMAAISSLPECESNPIECIDVNVTGTISVLDACRHADINKCIFASTGAVYEGNEVIHAPFCENLPIKTKLLYPTSKWFAEQICEKYQNNYGFIIPILRFFNVYGPRQDIYRKSPPLISYLITEFAAGRQPILHGNGSQSRDYVHVDDVVDICEKLLLFNENTFSTFNVCSGQLISIKEIVDIVKNVMNSNIEPIWRNGGMLWNSYDSLFEGNYPLNKSIINEETNKFAYGNCHRAKTFLNWMPNTNHKTLISNVVKEILINYV